MNIDVSTEGLIHSNTRNDHNSKEPLEKELLQNMQYNHTETFIPKNNTSTNDKEQEKHTEHNKKSTLMTKILRRLSKSSLFSKEKKAKKLKSNDKSCKDDHAQHSQSYSIKSSTIGANINHVTPQSKSFRNIFDKFGKKKVEGNMLSEPASSIESRPSVSINVQSIGSYSDYLDKLRQEKVSRNTPSSVNRILTQGNDPLCKENISESSNSAGIKENELKIDISNSLSHSVLNSDPSSTMISLDNHVVGAQQNNLNPSNSDFQALPHNPDSDKPSCVRNTNPSSNVRLTLSLYGYNMYGLKSSRFTSKSCIDFHSNVILPKSKISMDNIATFVNKVTSMAVINVLNEAKTVTNDKQREVEKVKISYKEDVVDTSNDNILPNEPQNDFKEPSSCLRKVERPTDIQLRRSRTSSQTSIARSSLIMVAVSKNTPRNKGFGNQVSTPTLNVDSPTCHGKMFEFVEEGKAIEEEKVDKVEKDGHYFLIVASRYENDISNKIEVVQGYLESKKDSMSDDAIGELNSAVGLAKLLLSEKFVQFKGLCDQNINGSNDNEFKTLVCDLEGYLTTLEIQIADLNKNFIFVEKIRENNWQIPATDIVVPKSGTAKRRSRPQGAKPSQADGKRSAEAKRRIAEYKKISANSNLKATNLINF